MNTSADGRRGMKIRRILVILGATNYGSVKGFADAMMAEWGKTHSVEVLDGSDFNQYARKKEEIFRGKKYDFIFAFNALALEEEKELVAYLLEGGGRYCTQLLDHPLYHHGRLVEAPPRCKVLVPDADHLSYLKKYYPNIHDAGFLPHGGSGFGTWIPYEDRDIQISFLGTYTSSRSFREGLAGKNEVLRVLQEELMNQLASHSRWTMEEAFSHMVEVYGLEEAQEDVANDLAALRDADGFIRSHYRERVLQAILEAGIPVDVYGDGWEEFSCPGRELLRVHPPCDYQEAIEVTARSKVSLNVMPWFKAGSHERVFNALCCGAVALTDRSAYFQGLEDQRGIVMYDLDQLEKLPGILGEILGEDGSGEQIALGGYENGRKNHLWACRAREILNDMEEEEAMRPIAVKIISNGNVGQLENAVGSIREYDREIECQVLARQEDLETAEWCREQQICVGEYGGEGQAFSSVLVDAMKRDADCDVLLLSAEIRCLPFCLERMRQVLYEQEKAGGVIPQLVTEDVIAGRKYFKDLSDYATKQRRGDAKRIADLGYRAVLLSRDFLQCVEWDEEYLYPYNLLLDVLAQGTRGGYGFYSVSNALAEECAEDSFQCGVERGQERDYQHLIGKWQVGYMLRQPNTDLFPFLPEDKGECFRVLEVGCSTGANLMGIGNLYPQAELYGLEINPRAAELAAAYGNVKAGNIEEQDVDFGDVTFDYIIFGDVLEHLRDPKGALEYCRSLLSEGGRVIASVPNLMHWSVMRVLIDGYFPYGDFGLLDRTHIHFFTYYEMISMFAGAGYEVLKVDFVEHGGIPQEVQGFVQQLVDMSESAEEFMFRAFQYQILAEKK